MSRRPLLELSRLRGDGAAKVLIHVKSQYTQNHGARSSCGFWGVPRRIHAAPKAVLYLSYRRSGRVLRSN